MKRGSSNQAWNTSATLLVTTLPFPAGHCFRHEMRKALVFAPSVHHLALGLECVRVLDYRWYADRRPYLLNAREEARVGRPRTQRPNTPWRQRRIERNQAVL